MTRWRWLPQPPGHLAVAAAGPVAAPPAVLLHGFLADSRAWRGLDLSAILPTRRWLAVDLPGHGRSAAVRLVGSPDPWRAVAQLLDASVAAHVRGPVAVVGYSAGGRVAAWWAQHSNLLQSLGISALVLESAHPGLLDAERPARLVQDQQRARELTERGLPAFVDAWQRIPLFQSQQRLGEHHASLLEQRRLRLAQQPAGLIDHLLTLGTGQMPRLDALPVRGDLPTFVLTGQEDTTYCALAARWPSVFPAAQLLTVAGAGHNVHLEAPDQWQRVVAQALGGQ